MEKLTARAYSGRNLGMSIILIYSIHILINILNIIKQPNHRPLFQQSVKAHRNSLPPQTGPYFLAVGIYLERQPQPEYDYQLNDNKWIFIMICHSTTEGCELSELFLILSQE